jgi:hypothetical protein
MTREELRDEIWDAIMNRMDVDVSSTDLADAALERLESLGALRTDIVTVDRRSVAPDEFPIENHPSPPTTTDEENDHGDSTGALVPGE